MLGSCDRPLSAAYDLAMLDLDGVVYIGRAAVPGAPAHLDRVRRSGMRCAFITNNASRAPAVVVEHLRSLGVTAAEEDVVTSAQAASRVLARELPRGARVAVLGATALAEEVRAAGLEPTVVDDGEAVALVSGYGPEVLWRDVMRAAVRVRGGLPWVASNGDLTIPTDYGVAPGHGVLVQTVSRFSGVDPVVAGKPEPPLLEETVRRVGGRRPLMVGDRLDTDIAGAVNAGVDSLLVLTGVTGLPELVAAAPGERPTYLAADLSGLTASHPAPRPTGDGEPGGWVVGGWAARCSAGRVEVSGRGAADDWWRAVACLGWAHLDRTGAALDVTTLAPPAVASTA